MTAARYTDQCARALAWLVSHQNADGSWSYKNGTTGVVEPTALALLAIADADAQPAGGAAALGRGVNYLLYVQRPDGSWGVSKEDKEGSWMTAYALWALRAAQPRLPRPEISAAVAKGLEWLLTDLPPFNTTPEQLAETRRLASFDGSLVGWPWLRGDTFWVFPTSLAIVAALSCGSGRSTRVAQGLDLLLDRVCEGGGWNFGNPYMIGHPYPPTAIDTALALAALRLGGRGGAPAVAAGEARLAALLAEAVSSLGFAWGALGLPRDTAAYDTVRSKLAALQDADGTWLRDPFTTAVAALALGERSPFETR